MTEWAKAWKLTLNADKLEATFFTTATNEATWQPRVKVENKVIKCEPTPRLLGVILDRMLGFGAQVDHVIAKIGAKKKLINAISNTEWGWKKKNPIQVYTAFINSAIEYAGFTYLSNALKTHLNPFNTTHRYTGVTLTDK